MRDHKNLLQETLESLEKFGKTAEGVLWVAAGSTDGSSQIGTWDDFAALAAGMDYNAGYGTEEVNVCLVIVGSTWWMERETYDGKEWWVFRTRPGFPAHAGPLTNLWDPHR